MLSLFPDLSQINEVYFFANAINTRTYGVDVVLNGFYNFRKSHLRYTLAANLNQTHLFGKIQLPRDLPQDNISTGILFNRADKGSIENGQPRDKITLSMNYQKGKTRFVLTNTRFGRTIKNLPHRSTSTLSIVDAGLNAIFEKEHELGFLTIHLKSKFIPTK